MSNRLLEDKLEYVDMNLRGIISEMDLFELLLGEAADDPDHVSQPHPRLIVESIGSIRMHLERVSADLSEVLMEQIRQNRQTKEQEHSAVIENPPVR